MTEPGLEPGVTSEGEAATVEAPAEAAADSGVSRRWLLGAGDNLEVMAPAELRRVVAAQSAKSVITLKK